MQTDVASKLPLLAQIKDRRLVTAFGLGFSSGMPFLLVYATQSAWLSEAGVAIATIGLLSELTLAYKFKFLWAPFLDRYDARRCSVACSGGGAAGLSPRRSR